MKLLHKMKFIVFILYLYYIIFILVNQYMYWEFIHPESNSKGKACYMQLFRLTCTDPIGIQLDPAAALCCCLLE